MPLMELLGCICSEDTLGIHNEFPWCLETHQVLSATGRRSLVIVYFPEHQRYSLVLVVRQLAVTGVLKYLRGRCAPRRRERKPCHLQRWDVLKGTIRCALLLRATDRLAGRFVLEAVIIPLHHKVKLSIGVRSVPTAVGLRHLQQASAKPTFHQLVKREQIRPAREQSQGIPSPCRGFRTRSPRRHCRIEKSILRTKLTASFVRRKALTISR